MRAKSPGRVRRKPRRKTAAGGWAWLEIAAALALLAGLSAAAVRWFFERGYLLYYGDAQAHLNIARRLFDTRTPNYEQIGTVWLPLPHLLLLPFVRNDEWWRNGLAGAFPSAACFVLAGAFLYAAMREAFESRPAAAAALAVFALNPNLLYLQSTAMTEPVLFAALMALLYFTVRFRRTQSLLAVAGAGLAGLAAALTRYEGWFVLPFAAAYFFLAARQRRLVAAALFSALAGLGPLYWLAHNWWCYGSVLEFYNGPYSAKAIYQRALDGGMARYPGDGDWMKAQLYFRRAVRLCLGWPLAWLIPAGVAAGLIRRAFWPVLFVSLAPFFYVWSMVTSGTPVFVPGLWPDSFYNTRYGLAALPLAALAAAALVSLAPGRWRGWAAAAVALAAAGPWLFQRTPEAWVCWKESQVNSEARRAWTGEAAAYLRAHCGPGDGILTSFGDLSAIFPQAGLPLRRGLHEGNVPYWEAVVSRPDLWLRERWAVAVSGDKVATAILRAERTGPRYRKVRTIAVRGGPVIEIYRRDDGPNSIHQGARREE